MELTPMAGGLGAEVQGFDFEAARPETHSDVLIAALDEHLALFFRDTPLDTDQYVRFGRLFGPLEDFPSFNDMEGGNSLPLSNVGPDGKIMAEDDMMRRNIAADALWHTDHTYMLNRARYSFLKAEIIPSAGGGTELTDTRAAYDALSDGMKGHLDGLIGLHSIKYSRSLVGFTDWPEETAKAFHTIPQPMVWENPRTGRKSLYIASHIGEILGMETGEARALVHDLIEHATQPQFTYRHEWRPGDIAVWDDRATMHRRAPYDDLNEIRQLRTMRVIEPSDLYDPEQVYEIS
jgi:alpha-ketoglutarate-dependent 2,4-dichlorophenoxyacetate dioxygenase